jgi:RNA polymerase sigma factor (sigma-70 family)
MLTRLKISATHEELFAERYDRLLCWSLHLAENDRELAEDLLHDAFIQFTFAQPDLKTIRNLDNYFYGMLRNLHLLHVRRETRNRLQQLSIVEYDSAEDGLRRIDLRDRLQVQDQLRKICQYVCVRREKSKSASVLILRFFHGYYPSEIAHILRTSRPTVDVHLLTARNEAKAMVDKPGALCFMSGNGSLEIFPSGSARSSDDFLYELRETIFQSRRSDCLSRDQLSTLYRAGAPQMESVQLAHIVSCLSCLDEVNKMLKLPLLQEGRALDVLGREKRGKGSGGAGPPGGAGPSGGASGGPMNSLRRRARTVIEHKPQELCVSVNGYVQGSQRINSELNELNLNVNISEEIGCVEVFSEQQVRLLLLSVDDPPPVGAVEQSSRIELSDGRTLHLTLRFRNPLPALQVVYQDPTFKEVEALLNNPVEPDITVESYEQGSGLPPAFEEPVRDERARTPVEESWLLFRRQLGRSFRSFVPFLMRPVAITAIAAIALILILLVTRGPSPSPTPVVSAKELLEKSVILEEAVAAKPDHVLHRIINLEGRKPGETSSQSGDGTAISHHRVEIWHSAEKGITARRLYDRKNALVAGDWRRKDGVQTLYHHGVRPRFQLPPDRRNNAILGLDEVWQLSPSPKDFKALIGSGGSASVEERDGSYVISYRNPDAGEDRSESTNRRPPLLVQATLRLNKANLHASELTLTMRHEEVNSKSETRNTQFVEYRLTEVIFEAQPPGDVPPSVFEPNPELLSERVIDEAGKMGAKSEDLRSSSSIPTSSAIASADLEVEVTYLLNQVKADLGEQVSLTRSAEGWLRVQGIVDTDKRKAEILSALAAVVNNPAVRIEVRTVEEAVRARKQRSSDSVVAGSLTATEGAHLPVDSQLRRYLAARGVSGERMDEEVREFSNRMIARSRQAMRHVFALKRLAEQFNEEQVHALSPDARAKRLSMFREHARQFESETRSLREQLEGVFASSAALSSDASVGTEINSEADLVRTVHRLFELSSSYNKAIGSAFAISSGESTNSAINRPQFWQLLRNAEKLAKAIQTR